jgi:hypothetical protein
MARGTAFFLLLAGCAGTQSQQAFTLRPAAQVELTVTAPNRSAERDRNLADCIERSLREQEEKQELQGELPAVHGNESTTVGLAR